MIKSLLLICLIFSFGCSKSINEKLIEAAKKGSTSDINKLVKEGANLNFQDDGNKRTALLWALKNKHQWAAEALAEHGADVNIVDKRKVSALMLASAAGFDGVVESLIESGVDVNVKDMNNGNAFSYAQDAKKKDVIVILKSAGARDPFESE